jgi:hypothetical protein
VRNIFLTLIFGFTINVCSSQNLIVTDLQNFGQMFLQLSKAKSTDDTLNLIKNLVINNGTETFKKYVQLKEGQNNFHIENEYLKKLRNYPKYYKSVLKQSEIFKTKKIARKVNNAFATLLKIYPEAKIKPTFICVGFMDDGGKSFETGQFVGIELFACNEKADTSELDNNLINYLRATGFDLNRIDELIIHELVHLSQFKGDNDFVKTFTGSLKYIPLLGEGGAAFITDLLFKFKVTIGPGTFNTKQFEYCEQNRAKLWQDYKNLKDNSQISDFFYGNNSLYPVRSIGYYLGYQVCKRYYNNATDKKKAIKEIIEVTDYDKLVNQSGF